MGTDALELHGCPTVVLEPPVTQSFSIPSPDAAAHARRGEEVDDVCSGGHFHSMVNSRSAAPNGFNLVRLPPQSKLLRALRKFSSRRYR